MHYTAIFIISLLCFCISCQCNQGPGQIGRALGPEMQRFTINIGQDTIIRCKGGMVLRFCPNTFMCAQKQFVLQVQEVRDRGEAFLLGISTLASDGRLLETEGMIYLNATTSSGDVVSINPDCPIRLEIPMKGRRAGTKWFQGNIAETGITWTEISGGLENQADVSNLHEYENGQFETYRDREIKIPHVPARMVAIGLKGKRWFKYEQPFTVGSSNIFTAQIQAIPAKEMEAFIRSNEFKQPQIEAAKRQCPASEGQ